VCVYSKLREDEAFDVGLGDGAVDVRENEFGVLFEQEDGEGNLHVNRFHDEETLVVTGLLRNILIF
jgi:hypothetical protein